MYALIGTDADGNDRVILTNWSQEYCEARGEEIFNAYGHEWMDMRVDRI